MDCGSRIVILDLGRGLSQDYPLMIGTESRIGKLRRDWESKERLGNQDLRRIHPARMTEASSAVLIKKPQTAISLSGLVKRSSSTRVSAIHQSGGPTTKRTISTTARATARVRLRPAL